MNSDMSIPSELKYSESLKLLNIPSKLNLRQYRPETSSSGYSNVNRTIRIPISGDVFIDTSRSKLSFSIKANFTAGVACLDNSAYSVIDSLRVIDSSGMILEEINNYGILANRLADINYPKDQRSGLEGKYAGFTDSTTAGTGAGQNVVFANNVSQSFSVPLVLSGIMNMTSAGHKQPVFLPIALTNGLFLEINLVANQNDPFVADTTPITWGNDGWTVNNVSFDAAVINFDKTVVQQLQASAAAAGGIFLSSYTYHTSAISSASQSVSVNMNERAKSIRSIYCIPRLDSQVNVSTQMITASPAPTNNGTINAFLQLASMVYPNVALNTYADVARELAKAVGTECAGMVNRACLESTTTTFGASVTAPARFTLGFDLDTCKDYLEAGYDNATNSQPITVNMTYDSAVARTYVVASLVDMIVKLDPIARTFSVSY